MKKVLVLVLAVILIMNMTVLATAASGTTEDTTKVFLVSSVAKDSACIFLNEVDKLSEEELEALTDAEKAELEAAVKGMNARDLFYFHTSEPTDVVFQVPNIRNLAVKQFVDGKWVTLKSTINADGTITVKDAVAAPMLIFTVLKNQGSPVAPVESATTTSLLPVLVSSTSKDCRLYSVTEGYKLEAEARQAFIDAQDTLRTTAPADMAARYFFYVCTSTPCTMVFRILNISEVVVKQYLDGKWVELETTINADGTVTVENVVQGPMAIFTK